MSIKNPWQSYRQVATKTAPPGQLVLMLFEGAIRFLERSLNGFEIEDPSESNQIISNNILRAQEIIHELNVSLNMEQGGEFARTMRQLYDYMYGRLMESNLRKERDGVDDTLRRLGILRDAWAQMLRGETVAPELIIPASKLEMSAA